MPQLRSCKSLTVALPALFVATALALILAAPALATYSTGIDDQEGGVVFDRFVTGFSPSYIGGSYVYGRWANTELTARFTGVHIIWEGPKQPNYGMADVYIDNVKKATVDCYAAPLDSKFQTEIFDSGPLGAADSLHTIKIRLTGEKNPLSFGNVVVVDRFHIYREAESGPWEYRQNESAGTFTGTWIKATNPTYTLSTYAYSRWAGPIYSASFTGTKVAWIGPKTYMYGKANVYIDGAFKGTVDCYSATMGWRDRIWESAALPYGTHTIQIRPTGTKTAASTNTIVVVDGLDVMGFY